MEADKSRPEFLPEEFDFLSVKLGPSGPIGRFVRSASKGARWRATRTVFAAGWREEASLEAERSTSELFLEEFGFLSGKTFPTLRLFVPESRFLSCVI